MGKRIAKGLIRQVMAAMGSRGGKTAASNMTPEKRSARAKIASLAAARKRTKERLARERAGRSAKRK